MIDFSGEPLVIVAQIVLVVMVVAMALTFYRMARGPGLPDRVVGLDLLGIILVGVCGVLAVIFDEPVFLTVAIALALVAFLATVAFARYAERRWLEEQSGEGKVSAKESSE